MRIVDFGLQIANSREVISRPGFFRTSYFVLRTLLTPNCRAESRGLRRPRFHRRRARRERSRIPAFPVGWRDFALCEVRIRQKSACECFNLKPVITAGQKLYTSEARTRPPTRLTRAYFALLSNATRRAALRDCGIERKEWPVGSHQFSVFSCHSSIVSRPRRVWWHYNGECVTMANWGSPLWGSPLWGARHSLPAFFRTSSFALRTFFPTSSLVLRTSNIPSCPAKGPG